MKNKRKIVVDASVARAAGDVSMHPVSANCRNALLAVAGLSTVFCPNLRAEWRKHESAFARAWKLRMIQQGRVIFLEEDNLIDSFREFIDESDADAFGKKAMDKDAHLISSALLSDKIVVALDERVRQLFAAHCLTFQDVGELLWSNPVQRRDGTTNWLKSGAKRDDNLTLAHFAEMQP